MVIIRRAGQAIIRLGKAATLLAILAGIPAGLCTQIGPPWPSHLPSLAALARALSAPVTDTMVAGSLAAALWILWAGLLACVAVEVAAAARGTPVPRLSAVAPLQAVVGWLLAGLTVGAIAVTPLAGTPPAGNAPRAAVAAATAATHTRAQTLGWHTDAQITVVVDGHHYTYRVAKGDNLSHIAAAWLGNPNRWPEIYQLNRGRHFPAVGGTLSDPNLIYPGWVLYLPPGARPPAAEPAGRGLEPTPAPHTTAGANATPKSPAPDPSAEDSAPTGPAIPNPRASTSGVRPAPSPHGQPTARPNGRHTGVAVPGGWVDLPLAAAIAAAGALVWLRRRHRHRPAPLATAVADDPDLRPLPRAATMMRRAVRAQAPDLLDPHGTGGVSVAEFVADPDPMRLNPTGPTGTDLAGLTDAIPPGGLGLTGPGAQAAARALLVASLSAGTPNDPDARGHVVITADAYATLLGAAAVDCGAMPRLTVTATLSEALTRVEETVIQRRRLLQDYGADDVCDLQDDPYHPSLPPVLLLAATPAPETIARLTSTVHLGAPLRIVTVLLGVWPRGENITIADDGSHGDDHRRLAVLDVATATDLLAMLREAHTGEATLGPPAGAGTGTGTSTGGESIGEGGAQPVRARAIAPQAAIGEKVQLVALGKPAVLDAAGHPIASLRTNAAQLMVFLAVHRRPAPFTDIMAALWPDARLAPARDRLFAEVSDLRRWIRDAAGATGIQPVLKVGKAYQLNADVVDVDIWRLARALQHAATAADAPSKITALSQAVAAHTGVLAEDADWDGVEQAREQVRRHGVTARIRLAELIGPSEPARAADLIEQAVSADPYNEAAAQQAMRAHAALGNPAAVRAHLQRLRIALGDIDTEPTTETIDLASQLIAEASTHRAAVTTPPQRSTRLI